MEIVRGLRDDEFQEMIVTEEAGPAAIAYKVDKEMADIRRVEGKELGAYLNLSFKNVTIPIEKGTKRKDIEKILDIAFNKVSEKEKLSNAEVSTAVQAKM